MLSLKKGRPFKIINLSKTKWIKHKLPSLLTTLTLCVVLTASKTLEYTAQAAQILGPLF